MAEGAQVPRIDLARVQDAALWERGRPARIGPQRAGCPRSFNDTMVPVNVG